MSFLEKVYCLNPANGQTIETTNKVFDSIYRDKGFELITRKNVDAANPIGSGAKTRKHEPASVTGSAASIAAAIGIDTPPDMPDVMTFPEAATKAKAIRGNERAVKKTEVANDAEKSVSGSDEGLTNNENESDVDGSAISEPREPNKRDRGGRK